MSTLLIVILLVVVLGGGFGYYGGYFGPRATPGTAAAQPNTPAEAASMGWGPQHYGIGLGGIVLLVIVVLFLTGHFG